MKNFMDKFARKAMWATMAVMATACQQHVPDLSSMYQQNATAIVGKFATSVSRGFTRPTGVNTRGLYDGSTAFGSTFSSLYGGAGTSSTTNLSGTYNNFNYYGSDPYGGQYIAASLQGEVQDCASYVKGVPAIPQNYQYMIGALARCLDRVLTYRNPLITFAYRNMPQQAQQQFGYLLNWRQPGTVSGYGGTAASMMNTYATQGYYPTQTSGTGSAYSYGY